MRPRSFEWHRMKRKLLAFVQNEIVLIVAGILALCSCFLTKPSPAYLSYIDFRVLALLFCLMAVVAGMQKLGLFDLLCRALLAKFHTMRAVAILLCLLSFFLSMLLTNDVMLVTIVPFTLLVLSRVGETKLKVIPLLVMETVSANLGSMLTPFGNPQNLYLYSEYGFTMGSFLGTMAPYTGLSLLLILLTLLFLTRAVSKEKVVLREDRETTGARELFRRPELYLYLVLFVMSLLSVLRILDERIVLAIVTVSILFVDRRILARVDYSLLLTFVFFFVFIGNIGQLAGVRSSLEHLIRGRVLLTAVLTSQFVSNVPAALLLSGFTEDGRRLLIGTDLGGLGTLIASMASLISYKFYAAVPGSKKGAYIGTFSLIGVLFLAVLLGLAFLLGDL